MAVFCYLVILIYLQTSLYTEDTNTTQNINITLEDLNHTSNYRDEMLNITELGVSPTAADLPAPTDRTPEYVTGLPDLNESTKSPIPDSPRATAAPAPIPVSGVPPVTVTEDEEGLSFATPEVQTDQNADSVFGRSNVSSATDVRSLPGYRYGDVIQTVNKEGQLEFFTFPASAGTAHCLDSNPAGFLKEQTSRCMRSFDLARDCTTLGTLSLGNYLNFSIRSGKNQGAKVIGVEVAAITLQSLEGTQMPVDPADSSSYFPVLLQSGDVCSNVVQQVKYTFVYNKAGEILNVMAAFLLGAIKNVMVPIQQEFQIMFLQENSQTTGLKYSGNPGYVLGRPLVAGTRTANGIVQFADPKGSLTTIQTSVDQDCLRGSSRRSPVLFGINTISGCTLKLSDGVNCSLLSEVILWALKGQSFPDHVASFGNSLPQNSLDWVPIQNQTISSGAQACSIPLSYHLEVKWTKYGALLNPQAQIVSIMETIITNTSSLAFITSPGGLLPVTSSVSFVDVSASATPGFKVPPTIDAKLPFDFFFPFV